MKLTTITIVTVDGMMQGLGATDEDCRGGFEGGRPTRYLPGLGGLRIRAATPSQVP
jgi:hypothetical protein